MQNLGHRYAKRLAHFIKNIKLNDVYVQATAKNRTQDSAIAYLKGMFEDWEEKPNFSVLENEDYLLSFYEVCEKYNKVSIRIFRKKERLKFLYPKIEGCSSSW